MTDIAKTYLIAAPPAKVWRALVDPAVIEAWGGGPAVMSAEAGSAFSLWGGDIHGTVTVVEPGRRLVEEWFGGDWPAPSSVTFTLSEDPCGTHVTLEQSGVPDDEAADIDAGWDDYYLGPLKALLE